MFSVSFSEHRFNSFYTLLSLQRTMKVEISPWAVGLQQWPRTSYKMGRAIKNPLLAHIKGGSIMADNRAI